MPVAAAPNFIDEMTSSDEGKLRLALLQPALAKRYDAEEYENYLKALVAFEPALAADIARVRGVSYENRPEIRLDTTGRQLLWAATLLRQAAIAGNDKVAFTETPLFRHLTGQPVFQHEILSYAQVLAEHFDQNDTRIRIGAPLSWFYFSKEQKRINLDPFHMLVFGLPRHPQDHGHSRLAAYHEVAHAILSLEWPAPMRAVQDRLNALAEKKKKNEALTPAEKTEILDLRAEFMLWGTFANLAEDNVVNRFAVILGRYRQIGNFNHAEAVKVVYALISKSRNSFEDFKNDAWSRYVQETEEFLGTVKERSALDQFNAIASTLGAAVPVHEGLLTNDRVSWESFGLKWDAFMPGLDDAGKLKALETLLQEGDGDPSSISYQQPYLLHVLADREARGIKGTLSEAATRFFSYLTISSAAIHAPQEVKRANDLRNAVIESLWKKYVDPLLPQIKEELKKQAQQKADQEQAGDPEDQIPGPPESGMGGDPDEEPQEGAKDDPEDAQPGKEGDKPKESSKPEEGDKPEEGKTGKGEADKIKPGKNENPGETLGELIEEEKNREGKEADNRKVREDALGDAVQNAKAALKPIKYDFPEGNWGNYNEAKKRLAWLIGIFSRQLDDLRRQQVQRTVKHGRHLEHFPRDGDVARLDRPAHLNLVARRAAHAPVLAPHYKRFVGDVVTTGYTTVQVVLLLDGSSSMDHRMDDTAGAPPIDIAISTGVGMFEASNQINARVLAPRPAYEFYSGIWGPANPSWITQPGTETMEAGKNFDRFRKGLKSTTYLAPALGMVAQKLSGKNSDAVNIGATHLMIVSDGDIHDQKEAIKQLTALALHVKNLTVDVIQISSKDQKIHAVLKAVKERVPGFSYGIHPVGNLNHLPITCLRALRQRMQRKIEGVPNAAKATQFKRALTGANP